MNGVWEEQDIGGCVAAVTCPNAKDPSGRGQRAC